MVSAPLNQSWIGRDMIVTSSPDAALVGRSGLVVDETRETITMLENNREVIFGKNSSEFKIGDSLSLIHISEPTRPLYISYAVFCLKKKKH